jgi:prepilin-type N-terminal cleavage/methylation domain-containing protein
MRHQRGFTLIELLVALVMMGVVTGALYNMLLRTQRLTRAQTERLDLQSNVRTAALVVPNELRELNTVAGSIDPTQVDITNAQSTSITYRAMRGLGFVCQSSAGEIRIPKTTWTGYRDPTPVRDGLYVFVENQVDLTSDDAWRQTTIGGVANSTCGITPAFALTIPNGVAAPPAGTPVRTFELMTLALYTTGGKWYLGTRSVNVEPGLQPLLGPLKDNNNAAPGLRFRYLDANGAETATLANIKSIVFQVRGVTEQKISSGGGAYTAEGADSLVTLISLRNAFR